MEKQKHICGQCNTSFDTRKEYLEHTCLKTGSKPTDPKHLGEGFSKVSEAALTRGNARVALEKEGKTPEEAIKLTRDIKKTVE